MALKFTAHVVQSFIKGHRKSILEIKPIELAHLEWNNVRFLPVTATSDSEVSFLVSSLLSVLLAYL